MDKIKKIFITATIGLLVLISLISCHKYPEDPFISLKRPWKRLEGSWKFDSYKINGTEHVHDFDVFLPSISLNNCHITLRAFYNLKGEYFLKDPNGNIIHFNDFVYVFDNFKGTYNTLNIEGDTSQFSLKLWGQASPSGMMTTSTWTIRELYGKHLHLNQGTRDIYFTKQ